MKVQEAVVCRIKRLCAERNMKISQLAYNAGMPASTLKNIMNGHSKNAGIVTIKVICDGLDIPLDEFFHSGLFHELEQEIE